MPPFPSVLRSSWRRCTTASAVPPCRARGRRTVSPSCVRELHIYLIFKIRENRVALAYVGAPLPVAKGFHGYTTAHLRS